MRMLPDTPSVDFLRREAKDLLAALREQEPATTLAEAQRTLARQYGAASWEALRIEVDRRRAEPPIPPPQFGCEIADAFDLGRAERIAAISYQHMGRAWSLQTDRGRWLVSPMLGFVDDQQARVGADLLERARPHGVLSPRPVPDRDGSLVHLIGDVNWRVDEWLDMGPTPMRPARVATTRRVGEMLATFHGLGIATDGPLPYYLTARRGPDQWDDLQRRADEAGCAWAGDLAALRPSIDALSAIRGESSGAGDRVVSLCDFVPEAVRYGPGDDLVVVHSAFAGATIPSWELGYVLVQWTIYGGVNRRAADALLDGYRSVAGTLPALDVPAFTLGIGGYLSWTYNMFCEAILAIGGEKTEFAEMGVREVLGDPLTVEKLELLLASVTAPSR